MAERSRFSFADFMGPQGASVSRSETVRYPHPQAEPVTEPGETAEFWLDIGRSEEPVESTAMTPGFNEQLSPEARQWFAETGPLDLPLTREEGGTNG